MRGDLLLIGGRRCHPVESTLFCSDTQGIGGKNPTQIQHTGNRLADQKPWQKKAFLQAAKPIEYCLPAGFLLYYLACTAIIFISPALSISNKLILGGNGARKRHNQDSLCPS